MSDIELVIKLPEEVYKNIQSKSTEIQAEGYVVENAILNGTPLPKGHDRLIDVKDLKKIIKDNDPLTMTGFNVRLCDIDNTPTIIEGDGEREE